nr:LptF/LptG family permease [Roseospira visakhapatnamensis]
MTRYVARQFLMALMVTLLVVAALILLFDVIELLRQTARVQEATLSVLTRLALLRLPLVLQTALPFVFMAGAFVTFWRLVRSSELVVIRAAGMSVWQMLIPLFLLTLLLGAINVAVFNPVAAALFTQFERAGRTIGLGSDNPFSLSRGGMWLRESGEDGRYTVVHARNARQDARMLHLDEIMIMVVDDANRTIRRIDAPTGRLQGGRFILTDAVVSVPGRPPDRRAFMTVKTGLSIPKIEEKFAAPETISFWDLPSFIAFFESAGFSASAHRMHWHALVSSPVMLCAMILVAAVFGLGSSSRRGAWLARLAGAVVAGFVVYFFSQVTYTLGQSQTLPVVMAAWSPTAIAGFLGLALMFQLEDG